MAAIIAMGTAGVVTGTLIENYANPLNDRVQTAAKRVLQEIAIACAITTTAYVVTATALSCWSISILATALIISAVAIQTKVWWNQYHGNQPNLSPWIHRFRYIPRLAITNVISMAWLQIAVHEAGHALAALAFFINAHVRIRIIPFVGGSTKYVVSRGLTSLGNLLGKERAILVATAAGGIASLVFGMVAIGVAYGLRNKYPKVSQWIGYTGVAQLVNEALYSGASLVGLRAAGTTMSDYAALKLGGLHPVIPFIVLIALPILQSSICWVASGGIKRQLHTYVGQSVQGISFNNLLL